MIDTDKYEGHTEGAWKLHYDGSAIDDDYLDYGAQLDPVGALHPMSVADALLIADAPLLLAEVKRLRGVIAKVWDLMQNSNHEEREVFFWGFDKKDTGWLKIYEELAMKELNWGEEE
jgi:hypothetical protein